MVRIKFMLKLVWIFMEKVSREPSNSSQHNYSSYNHFSTEYDNPNGCGKNRTNVLKCLSQPPTRSIHVPCLCSLCLVKSSWIPCWIPCWILIWPMSSWLEKSVGLCRLSQLPLVNFSFFSWDQKLIQVERILGKSLVQCPAQVGSAVRSDQLVHGLIEGFL